MVPSPIAGALAARRWRGEPGATARAAESTPLRGWGARQRVAPGALARARAEPRAAVALLALYVFRLSGSWRWLYVVAAMMALYLDAFVTVVQAFQKIAPLHALAPTESGAYWRAS